MWIELRGRQARVYYRRPEGGRAFAKFSTRNDAERFRS